MQVDWKERCNYCINREECKYKEKVLELMDILDDDEYLRKILGDSPCL